MSCNVEEARVPIEPVSTGTENERHKGTVMDQQDNDTNVSVAPDSDARDGEHTSVESAGTLQRRGDVEKCPVCGSGVDADAYHCPSCRNYFCYQCRARMLPADPQLQCVNQKCDYYGKLVCGVCDTLHEKEEPPVTYAEPEDGYWPGWLLLVLLAAGLVWYFRSFNLAVQFAVVVFFAGGYLIHRLGLNVFGWERNVEHQRKSSYYTCLCCEQPVKELQSP